MFQNYKITLHEAIEASRTQYGMGLVARASVEPGTVLVSVPLGSIVHKNTIQDLLRRQQAADTLFETANPNLLQSFSARMRAGPPLALLSTILNSIVSSESDTLLLQEFVLALVVAHNYTTAIVRELDSADPEHSETTRALQRYYAESPVSFWFEYIEVLKNAKPSTFDQIIQYDTKIDHNHEDADDHDLLYAFYKRYRDCKPWANTFKIPMVHRYQFFPALVEQCAFLGDLSKYLSLQQFHDTLASVKSRILQLQDGSICLVPMIDFANHSASANARYDIVDGAVSLVAEIPISAGEEVFIKYDDRNDLNKFITCYGFAEPFSAEHEYVYETALDTDAKFLSMCRWFQILPTFGIQLSFKGTNIAAASIDFSAKSEQETLEFLTLLHPKVMQELTYNPNWVQNLGVDEDMLQESGCENLEEFGAELETDGDFVSCPQVCYYFANEGEPFVPANVAEVQDFVMGKYKLDPDTFRVQCLESFVTKTKEFGAPHLHMVEELEKEVKETFKLTHSLVDSFLSLEKTVSSKLTECDKSFIKVSWSKQ